MGILPEVIAGNADAVRDAANEMEKRNPSSGLPNYYRAAVSWRLKNKGAALSELQVAMSKEPQNERYKSTYSKASQSAVGTEGVFGVNFNIGFDDL